MYLFWPSVIPTVLVPAEVSSVPAQETLNFELAFLWCHQVMMSDTVLFSTQPPLPQIPIQKCTIIFTKRIAGRIFFH